MEILLQLSMLQLFKELSGIELSNTSKDTIYNFYINKSRQSISSYKQKAYTDEEFGILFLNQCVELAIYYYANKNNVGLSSVTQGGRSLSKASTTIPTDIILSLGLPSIKVGTVG